MKNCNASEHRTTRRILPIAHAAALAVVFTVSLPQPAHAGRVTPPPVPEAIDKVPAGNKAFLVGHAVGTQNYICLPSASAPGFAWTLFTPQATLFKHGNKQVTTHYFSPNPFEPGTVRPTWQHSRDTSTVWARLFVPASSDPDFVAPGAIPWLLLEVAGAQDGPLGGHTLAATTFIHRVNTVGGAAPSIGCTLPEEVGRTIYVPYEADYFFYTQRKGGPDHDD